MWINRYALALLIVLFLAGLSVGLRVMRAVILLALLTDSATVPQEK